MKTYIDGLVETDWFEVQGGALPVIQTTDSPTYILNKLDIWKPLTNWKHLQIQNKYNNWQIQTSGITKQPVMMACFIKWTLK